MRRKPLDREIRFRAGKPDLEKLKWLVDHEPDPITQSALIRYLISAEYNKRRAEYDRKKGSE